MTTKLDKTLRREVVIKGRPFVVSISPVGLLITLKGHRKGKEFRWEDLVGDEAALAVALNASLGMFEQGVQRKTTTARKKKRASGLRR